VANGVTAGEGTSTTGYTDLPSGKSEPSVTVTVPESGRALVAVTSSIASSTGSESCYMGISVNGATATDARALILAGATLQTASASYVIENLKANESNTFTAQYRASLSGKVCTFSNRSIWAIPLP
jgi:hypothetical protein